MKSIWDWAQIRLCNGQCYLQSQYLDAKVARVLNLLHVVFRMSADSGVRLLMKAGDEEVRHDNVVSLQGEAAVQICRHLEGVNPDVGADVEVAVVGAERVVDEVQALVGVRRKAKAILRGREH